MRSLTVQVLVVYLCTLACCSEQVAVSYSSVNANAAILKGVTISSAVPFEALKDVSYMMSRERLRVPSSNLNPFTDTAFVQSYINELKRLEKNWPTAKGAKVHQAAVATCDETGKVVGYIDIDKRFRDDQSIVRRLPAPYISDLVVDERWRRQGVAKRLIRFAEDICFDSKQWHLRKLHLMADVDNVAATTLYLKDGYIPLKMEKGPVEDPPLKTNIIKGGDPDVEEYLSLFKGFDRVLFCKKRNTVKLYCK